MKETLVKWIIENKYKVIVGVLLVVVIMAWTGRKKTPIEIKTIKMTAVDYGVSSLENKTNKINWKNDKIEIPTSTEIIENRVGKIGTVELMKLAEWIGTGKMTKNIDSYGLLSYKDEDKGHTIYVNQDNNMVHFNRGYMGDDYYKIPITEQDIIASKKEFEKLSEKLSVWINGGKIKMSNIYFQKIDGPRAITAEKNDANVINITADILFDNKILYTSYGAPLITARYGSEGVLLELKIENPQLNLTSGSIRELMDWDNIIKIKNSEINVFEIGGNPAFEKSTQEDELSEINITYVSIGYLYSPVKAVYLPFLIGEGNSRIDSGPVRVKIGVLLVK